MKNPYSEFYALLKKIGLREEKESILLLCTAKKRLNELTPQEYQDVIVYLRKQANPIDEAAIKRMRSKIIGLCQTKLGLQTADNQIDWQMFNSFMVKTSYLKKPLNHYTLAELPKLVSQIQKIAKTPLKNENNHLG